MGTHIKKCPICQEPFTDVNLFMTHLSKCNISSDEEEEEENKDEGGEMVSFFSSSFMDRRESHVSTGPSGRILSNMSKYFAALEVGKN
jgi:hypothetical protein